MVALQSAAGALTVTRRHHGDVATPFAPVTVGVVNVTAANLNCVRRVRSEVLQSIGVHLVVNVR